MKRIIVGIHGLGNKPPKELAEKWWKKSIIDGLRIHNNYFLKPKFDLIYWADILHPAPLDFNINDKTNPNYLDEPYKPYQFNSKNKPNLNRKKILDQLEKITDKIFLKNDLSLNIPIISEYVIHKYFEDLENYYKKENIKDLIRNRAAKILTKNRKKKIFFIGHSMGSIIAYDVLVLNLAQVKVDTFATIGSPLGIPIVQSKIAKEIKADFPHTVKLTTPSAVTKHWFNFSDLQDKVAVNYNLADDYDPNDKGIAATDFIVENDYSYNNIKNPHKSYGYLRTPEFSNVVYGFMMEDRTKMMKWILGIINETFKILYMRIKKPQYD
ncbi:MAG: hypothetical protein FJ214_03905 [Ignavibacteria bacterium]|nr:hypothetical protein [Ignavibacteria bacterium]